MSKEITPLAEQIRKHLEVQFPATVGHIPLKNMLLQVYTMEEELQEEMQENERLRSGIVALRDSKGRFHTQKAAEELFKLLSEGS